MKKIIVTTSWDDGHVLDLKLARLLKKYSIKGTFYIAPRNRQFSLKYKTRSESTRLTHKYRNILEFYLNSKRHRFSKKDLLSDTHILNLSKDFEVGGHTITHPNLTSISKTEAKKEVVDSKKYLERLTGKEVVSFCYPGGRNNPELQKLVKDAGFKYARTTDRFVFSVSKRIYESGTSLHAMNQYQDVARVARFSGWDPISSVKNVNWELLAKTMFDFVSKKGGVLHLFGHSWIIDIFDDWDRLERVFAYIANNKDVRYIENKDLVKLSAK